MFGCHSFSFLFSKKSLIRCPIQRITGTAILFPIALYLGASGHCSALFPRHGCGFNAAAQAGVADVHFR
ncbi:hypothetical protein GCWU000324_01211 [Kingella oralis ATCC 51147]|uniref:Uncharacterized protein n=1 Tax=Kingella oralis ATCC 51147 TaxID=629741 RepID=C4GGE4_9NEIS|nr:hypothetical protein GCWU000324_01211 [Kingella oralis ATCC 51147]